MANKKHDWVALKKEFFLSDEISVAAFMRKKGINAISTYYKGWSGEKEAWKKEQADKALDAAASQGVEDELKVRERQARLAKFLQLKGAQKLQTMEVETVDDARKLVISGMQEERRALGMEGGGGGSTHNTLNQFNFGPKLNIDKLLEKLDYEGVLGLIAELKRERARRTLQSPAGAGTGAVQEGEAV